MADKTSGKRHRDGPFEHELDSPEVKRLRNDLFDLPDDTDPYSPAPDLDFVMKSFAEEISAAPCVVDLTEHSGESQPELGYLLEASDDELGLPPSTAPPAAKCEEPEPARFSFDAAGIDVDYWGFCGDEIPKYDSFEFGFGESDAYSGGGGDYVALDGLFDYSDAGMGSPSELSDSSPWRPRTLPAL